ncbi:MAG TPA: UDP-N-acetylmuramate dehydrogenase [Steroidobacteraceae bacterium]|jgi:UDP-N-acetylmuramate dehydrogenase|nr:UDP-N-acetylmuramate dehydrogenase [Steroidobacteraceae bacterium]
MNVELAPEFKLRMRRDEPMSKHTSWRVGGPADLFFTPRDRDDLSAFLRTLPEAMPLLWVGLGSNLLVRDGGIRGAVVCTHGAFTRLERRAPLRVYCESGVPCARLTRQCGNWGLGQAEFFAGIPGTLGGALAMNAGAFGGETWRQVRSVEVIARDGSCRTRAAGEYQVSYRQVAAPANDEWFLAAEMEFTPRDAAAAGVVRELAQRRKQTQPLGEWSCGSVFTNPEGDHAARLIEAAGLKGARIGGAVVAEKHANFILNEGQATAADIEELINQVRETVQRVHGVLLVPEVRMVGEAL